MKQEHQFIYDLEISLLRPEVRKSPEQLRALIADEFVEHGSSGMVFNKNDIIDFLPAEAPRSYHVENFKIMELSQNTILATYKVTLASECSLRSSVWQYINNRWQMVFHQGTPCDRK